MRLKNKIGFITGGTAGIGRAAALAMAQEGSFVTVTGRRIPEGEETVRLVEELGGSAEFIRMDAKSDSDIENAIGATLSRHGRIDVAFNNAGVETVGPLTEATREAYEHIFDVNVWGFMACMKHQLAAMLPRGAGSIINNSSVVGRVGLPGTTIYTASKHAVEGLTKAAALEVAKAGVRVNVVCPALVRTEMADRFAGAQGAESRAQVEELHPIGRSGHVGEIASAVVFLASDEASFITGSSLAVDGGWLAR